MKPAVLFVCLGNICRSPLAEAAFRCAVEEAGLDIRIDSAGTGDWHVGKAPDPRAIATARRNGCDIAQYRRASSARRTLTALRIFSRWMRQTLRQ